MKAKPYPDPNEPDIKLPAYIESPDDYNWDNDIIRLDDFLVIRAEDAQAYRLYLGGMGRIPDKAGFDWWSGYSIFEGGAEWLKTMSDGFVYSSEFKSYADMNADGEVSNHEFVTHMYENVFEREPDRGGYNYWIGELDSGASDQGDVLMQMTQSNEYIDQTLEVVAAYLFL